MVGAARRDWRAVFGPAEDMLKRWCNRTKKWSNGETGSWLCWGQECQAKGEATVVEWRFGFAKKCNQLSSRHRRRPIWGPVQRRGFWRRSGTGTGALTTAGQQVARVDGGAWAQPWRGAWEATIKAGQTNRWNGRRGFCASRVTSSRLSAWSTSVLVSHRDDFCRSSTEGGGMAECH
jgi:hypothetical protein